MSRDREYAVFGSQNAAQNYVHRCNTALGYPKPGTTTYAIPEEREDGKWVVLLKHGIDDLVQGGGAPLKEVVHRNTPGKRMLAEIASAAIAPPPGNQAVAPQAAPKGNGR
jgi:hypothetical protein